MVSFLYPSVNFEDNPCDYQTNKLAYLQSPNKDKIFFWFITIRKDLGSGLGSVTFIHLYFSTVCWSPPHTLCLILKRAKVNGSER